MVRPKVLQRYATVIEEDLYAPKPSNKPLPATAKIVDSTLETVKKSSESVKQASEQVKQASEQMKTSVSDLIRLPACRRRSRSRRPNPKRARPAIPLTMPLTPAASRTSRLTRRMRSNEKWPSVRSGRARPSPAHPLR